MKIFISSLIAGMEPIRVAARSAVTTLGHEPIMAEDFGALPHSPQIACLGGVRQAGVVVLVLGARYGAVQPSGLSATHEEYREARERCPVLAFVEDGITPEPKQDEFIREVQAWDSGLIRAGFSDAVQLERKIIHGLHRFSVASASAPFDASELAQRTLTLFPEQRGAYQSGGAVLSAAIAGGPAQAILRPSQIEDAALSEMIEREALYGAVRLFQRGEGTTSKIEEGALILGQDGQRGRGGRSIQLDPQGSLLIRLPVESEGRGFSVVLIETLHDQLAAALRFAASTLDKIDPAQRLSHVAVAAQLTGGMAIRTRREHEASPNSIQMSGGFGRDDHKPVHLSPPHMARAALSQQAGQIIEDLVTLILRQRR
ncbi:DUF4062 domain-containing protein [Roseomonas mucosa]|uniref:DUF4062 domain-containing protein n=1 Tax=Roseomonas mucosa TaxID=207340 RepID=UPI001EF50A48|nr:DUF4062 domain-containing protein [Roseomonas mucosa]